MSKEIKSILLGTATGAGVDTGERKQLIDLDETYEDAHTQKEVDALSTYLKTGKLTKEAAVASNNSISGQERFEPGCTKLNGVLGGESFLNTVANGVVAFVEAVIKVINSVVKWVLTRIKSFVDFMSDAREVQKGDAILRDIEDKLVQMGGPSFNLVDLRELFADEPASARRLQIVRMLRARNLSTLATVQNLEQALPDLKNIIQDLSRQDQNIARTQDKFAGMMVKLRKRVKERSLTRDDVAKFEAELNALIVQNLQIHTLKRTFTKLTEITTNNKVPGIDVDAQFRNSIEQQNKVMSVVRDEVSVNDLAAMALSANQIRADISANPDNWGINLTRSDVIQLDDIVSMKDLDLIKEIAAAIDDKRVVAVYRDFVAQAGRYTTAIRECIQLAVRYSDEVKYISEWAQRYELILGVFSLRTVKERMEARKAYKAATGSILDTGGLKDVAEDGMSDAERGARNIYDSLFPKVKSLMNMLSRKINAGVTVK